MALIDDLKLERRFAAAPAAVFDAWLDPQVFPLWFGPADCTIPEFEIDPRVGGVWRAVMLGVTSGKRHEVSGVYTKVERPRRLAFTWAWTQDDGSRGREYRVEIRFEPDGAGTRLVLTHAGFDDADDRERHGAGWASTLDCLAAQLEAAPAS